MRERFQDTLRTPEKRETSVNEVLTRGVESVLPEGGLRELMGERKIRLYLGIDATSPDLHIGHTVPLRKLEQFRKLGHKVILLFGGFTSEIGDPSDKSATRVRLTPDQVKENMATYLAQAGRVLDVDPNVNNPIDVVDNAEWLSAMSFRDVVELASNFSVQQIEQRDMFKKRRREEKPIWLHELLYPLMQGQDAVHLDVDLEVGGNDQTFNMLIGADLVRRRRKHQKWVMAMQLIEDPSGRKMSKSEGNVTNVLDWPEIKYEGIMTWPDAAVGVGFELITSVPMDVVHQVQEEIVNISESRGSVHPMELKKALAYQVIAELDGVEAAEYAQEEFKRVKREGQFPRRMAEVQVGSGMRLKRVLVEAGLADNEIQAGHRIKGGSVFIDGTQVRENLAWSSNCSILSIGKKSISKVRKVAVS